MSTKRERYPEGILMRKAIRNEGTDSQSLNPQFRFPFVLVIDPIVLYALYIFLLPKLEFHFSRADYSY